MREANISPEVVVTIIFGILQLIMAATALWQQHYLRWENFFLSKNQRKVIPIHLKLIQYRRPIQHGKIPILQIPNFNLPLPTLPLNPLHQHKSPIPQRHNHVFVAPHVVGEFEKINCFGDVGFCSEGFVAVGLAEGLPLAARDEVDFAEDQTRYAHLHSLFGNNGVAALENPFDFGHCFLYDLFSGIFTWQTLW
ncbi:hypothetical protein HG531_013290 [Fusarium graminearum]|nr:hypothetical protein HG531_013290 [Fusarium graminearum]